MNESSQMTHGTISGFDPRYGVGLIDSDDGGIVLFNATSLDGDLATQLAVGVRVLFLSHGNDQASRAESVRISE